MMMAARRIAFHKVRRIFFDLTSVPDLSDPLVNGWAGPLLSITQQRPLIARHAWPLMDAARPNRATAATFRSSHGRRNETRSLS
jgi:hypothetical protein